jgi:hypothetical protein
VQKAYEGYQAHVINGSIAAEVFSPLFHAYYANVRTDANPGCHAAALYLVGLLLNERNDLCAVYFTRPKLNDDDIKTMWHLILTGQRIAVPVAPTMPNANPLANTLLKDDFAALTECINKLHVFAKEVTPAEVEELIMCSFHDTILVQNVKWLCYLFDNLQESHFIGRWQTSLEKTQSLISPKTGRPIKASNMSTVLTRIRKHDKDDAEREIDDAIKHVKEIHKAHSATEGEQKCDN